MNPISPYLNYLSDRRVAMLSGAVDRLEAAIRAGVVPNKLFTEAKETINRAVDEAVSAFDKSRSEWNFKSVMCAHDLTAAVKEATQKKAAVRLQFLSTMLPLNDLLQSAKPLIVKRQTGPSAPKTAAQIEREAATMTCQCCGKKYLANLGTIAHHGYQRPGGGWQTASCMGAKAVPFEVGRGRLTDLIVSLIDWESRAARALDDVEAERIPVALTIVDLTKPRDHMGRHPSKTVNVTRDTFDAICAQHANSFRQNSLSDFDDVKDRDIGKRQRELTGVRDEIKAQQARFDSWKQTHAWDAASKTWKAKE